MSQTDNITPEELNERVSAAVAAQTQPLADSIANLSKLITSVAARPASTPAANVDANSIPRTRGTIVTAASSQQAAVQQAAFVAFNYRAFLQAAKPFAKTLDQTCRQFGYSQLDAFIQISHESAWNPLAKSSAGAIGLCQIMPDTAKDWGVNPFDPADSIRGLVVNMKQYREGYMDAFKSGAYHPPADPTQAAFYSLDLALAAYDAGPGAVEEAGGIPSIAETLQYVQMIGGTVKAILSSAVGRSSWNDDWNALLR